MVGKGPSVVPRLRDYGGFKVEGDRWKGALESGSKPDGEGYTAK
jgi:hypothetical protein